MQKTSTMKKFILIHLLPAPWAWLGLILFFLWEISNAQNRNPSSGSFGPKQYHVKVTLNSKQNVKGILRLIGDNRIQLLEKKVVGKDSTGVKNAVPDVLHYGDIYNIKFRGTVGQSIAGTFVGVLIGAVAGGALGFILPKNECDDSTDPNCDSDVMETRIGLGILGAGVGGIVGGIFGASDGPFIDNFEITGQFQNFQIFRGEMKKRGMEIE